MGSDTVAACAALHLGKKGTWCTFQRFGISEAQVWFASDT